MLSLHAALPTFNLLARQTAVTEQVNNIRSQELALEQTRLANTRAVLESQLETAKARRQYEREQPLAAKGFVAGKQFADTTDQYAYERKRLAAVKNSQSRLDRSQG